jgi:hypothetical protein
MNKAIFITIVSLIVLSCQRNSNKQIEKKEILKAGREAPLGWVYLTIYEDSTFQFVLTGIRSNDKEIFSGKVRIVNDSLLFAYTDSIPKAGNTAIIKNKMVIFTNGEYSERLDIGLNEIIK